jgi:septal ring factor EnvC (AmiA/AmiB activator)
LLQEKAKKIRSQVSSFMPLTLKYSHSKHWFVLAVALLFSSPALSQNQNQNNNTGLQAQQELESVATAIEDIRGWLNTATQAMSTEQSSLKQADSDLARLSKRTNETRINIQQTQTELDALAGQAHSLNLLKTEQAAILNQLIKAVYIRGGPNLLKTFFSQDGQTAISDSARMLHYTLKFSEAQLRKVSEFETLIERIKSTEIVAAAKVAELEQHGTALNNQLAALDLARLEKQNALASLRSSIASKGQELEQLEINQAELQRLVEEIRVVMEGIRSFADVPPFAGTRGRLAPPLAGKFSSRFGERYGEGNLSRQGITIEAETGTPVRAVHAGHVVFADWLRGSGLLVIVDHGSGYLSLYGGNEALSAIAGKWVNAGDIVSTSGTSISSGEDGLYFEIRRNGQPQDPSPWFSTSR